MHVERVSLDEVGRQFDGQSFLADISADGRKVFFDPGQFGFGDAGDLTTLVYEFDTVTGRREPVSVRLAAEQTIIGSDYFAASAEGSVLAFDQAADGLVPGDTNEARDVFALDRRTGDLVRASESGSGEQADGESVAPVLAADGGELFFASAATNLVPGDANGLVDVFVRDLAAGTLTALTLARPAAIEGLDLQPRAVSADGGKLLLIGDDSDRGGQREGTFLLDRATGSVTALSPVGNRFTIFSDQPDLSADGTLALVPGAGGGIELVDLVGGGRTPLAAGEFVGSASLSADGRFAAFVTAADGLVPEDTDGLPDIFVHDRAGGNTWRVTVDEQGEGIAGRNFGAFAGVKVETAAGEEFPILAFTSDSALVGDDTNGTTDVYAIEVDAIAVADVAVTAPGAPVRIDALANDIDLDGDPATIAGLGSVADGTAVVEGGAIVFTPAAGFADDVTSFTYTLDDGEGNTSRAIVRVAVVEDGPLVVTTADDVVAPDGELSLREAVLSANARDGADTITFADNLRGGTLVLDQGALSVTDDLVIDGDPADGGPGGVTLQWVNEAGGDYNPIEGAIRAGAVSLRLEDATLAARSFSDSVEAGILGDGADIAVVRSALTGFDSYGGSGAGIRANGGSVLVQSSTVSSIGGYAGAQGIEGLDARIRVEDSRITRISSEYADGISARGEFGSLEVTEVEIATISGVGARGIISDGPATVTRSTITSVSAAGYGAVGIQAHGSLTLENSTVANVLSDYAGGGVVLHGTATGTITNTTIASNLGTDPGFAGLVVGDGASLQLENSLVAGNAVVEEASLEPSTVSDLIGTVASNGHNLFGQAAVDGAVEGDVTGAAPRDVFAVLDADGRPVVADNGGPTRTVALLANPANPALDAADPTVAPAVDQRGAARVGPPDIGSYEASGGGGGGGADGLPPLAEGVAVDPALVNGVDPELLRGDGATPFAVTLIGTSAAKDNAVGFYIVEDDYFGAAGAITEAGILFASGEGTPEGATVQVGVLEPGQRLGLFLVSDGADRNGAELEGDPDLSFFDRTGDNATVFDRTPGLFVSEPDDFGRVRGPVFHASDFDDAPGNDLNPRGLVRTLSALAPDGDLLIAWEDQRARSDLDFNDLIVRVERATGPDLLL